MLVAPLDWGLGHATRCIPLIEKILQAGFKVIIAAEGDQKILLQRQFPGLEMLNLKGYRLQYGSTKMQTIARIIFQTKKILTAINAEKLWLRAVVAEKNIAVVISDNRFGCYDPRIPSVFLTHQLYIDSLLGGAVNRLLQRINYRFINRFTACWVPDAPGASNLAGMLSHPSRLPRVPIMYIGPISRITRQPSVISFQLLIILSGPEPQRTLLEQKLIAQLNLLTTPACIVRGLPAEKEKLNTPKHVVAMNYADGKEMQRLINASSIILCRAGYSTLMEIIPLQKHCIFVPTPGQGEQQYLARHLAAQGYGIVADQNDFDLGDCITRAEKIKPPEKNMTSGLDDAIVQLKRWTEERSGE